MVSKNFSLRRASRIALGIMAIMLLLQAVQYAGAQSNNGSSETGVTYTQDVPYSTESIAQVKANESKQPAEQRVIPFYKAPQPKELKQGTAPPKPLSAVKNELFSSLAPVLGSSFIGIRSDGFSYPPDTMGAAGPSHLMEITNENIGFFNKSAGALISSVSLQGFWSSLGTGTSQPDNFPFDPKVIYDQHSGRFIAETLGGTTSPNSWLMIAVSNTSDPTGNWSRWAIDADKDGGVQTFNNFADFPGLGVDANNVYVTANMFNNFGLYQYSRVWVVPKIQLLNGNASITVTEFRDPTGSGFTMQPAYVFGSSSTEYFVNENYSCPDPNLPCLALNSITFPGGTPTWNRLGDIAVNNYTPDFNGAPQSGTSTLIETNDRRLLNAVFRDGFLWTTHTVGNVSVSRTEVAWYQINPANASLSLPFGTPAQQGRISDASRWYYFPSIAVNANGDVGIGFSGSNATEFASAYYTARNTSDAPGTMQPVGLLKAGLASYTRNRWGDYSATVIDPIDNTTFWTVQEYAATSNLWGTWWGKFALVTPSLSISASSSAITVGTPTNVTFTVTSSGSAISGATVSLSGTASGGGTTDINGNATISVNASSAGSINATASLTGYTNGSTTVTASEGKDIGNTTIGVYRNSISTFFLRNSNTEGISDIAFNYGMPGDIPLAGDWDRNGNTTIGVYRPSTSTFFLRNSNTGGVGDIVFNYGMSGDIPVAGDWDGNGNTTIGVYRPSTSTFFLRNSNTGGVGDIVFNYGMSGDIPVAGDWDGNGNTTIGVYRPSTNTFFLKNSNTAGFAEIVIPYGMSGDIPVVGDWDGNGNTTIGVYRPSINTFFLRNSNTGGVSDIAFNYGTSDDTPVVGDWNGQ
jgi:hypothetical protein